MGGGVLFLWTFVGPRQLSNTPNLSSYGGGRQPIEITVCGFTEAVARERALSLFPETRENVELELITVKEDLEVNVNGKHE